MNQDRAKKPPLITLRQFNNYLSIVIAALSIYIILAPLWPNVQYQIQEKPPLVVSEEQGKPEVIPKENTLVIPRIKLQQTIHEGGGEWVLNKGIWHMPNTSSPDKGSNMVMSGHRFTYAGPAILYHLDKVKKGDKIIVYWQQKKYEYAVANILIVPPTQTEIQGPTDEPLLTIYTCTPLVTAKNRLVLQAKPLEVDQ